MTIDEAIETLHRYYILNHNVSLAKVLEASKLGIEALKRCKYIAEHTDRWAVVLLPGETKD